MVDEEALCGCATTKSLFIYLFIYLLIYLPFKQGGNLQVAKGQEKVEAFFLKKSGKLDLNHENDILMRS